MNYERAEQIHATSRFGKKPLGERSTWLEKDNDDYLIRYHATAIVRIHRNGLYTLQSGGWSSKTTKKRINDYSPARLFQRKQVWYLRVHVKGQQQEVEFYDGIIIDSNGNIADLPQSVLRRLQA
jgi:cellulose biosynthesis protein BcsQ